MILVTRKCIKCPREFKVLAISKQEHCSQYCRNEGLSFIKMKSGKKNPPLDVSKIGAQT